MLKYETRQLLPTLISLKKVSVNDIGHGHRGEGRTFRRLMLALYEASVGEKIIYALDSDNLARWTMDKALAVCAGYGIELSFKKGSRTIQIPKAGSIKFVVLSDNHSIERLRGITGHLIEDFD